MSGESTSKRSVVEKIVIVFLLGYGMHYLGYFLRIRYFNWLDSLSLDEGMQHCCMYLGHTIFLLILLLYAWAVKGDRKYILSFAHGRAGRNLKYAFFGALVGFGEMGICILAASMNGNLTIRSSASVSVPIFIFAALCVFIQATTEEVESRAFVFGKMHGDGVPLVTAAIVSSFYFSYLHAANPGFGLLPLLSIFIVGIQYVLCYHYFRTIWFNFTAHMVWNYTQDFLFGLPDSGKPAAVSVFSTEVQGSGFFYDKTFGIEGSWMAILMNFLVCIIVFAVGKHMRKKESR